jgi:group I intron endonuclease
MERPSTSNYKAVLQNINLTGFTPVVGIYKIVNLITGKTYIGSSVNVYTRITQHVKDIINQTHCNKDILQDISVYGLRSFEVCLLEECDVEGFDKLTKLEYEYVNKYRGLGVELYNATGYPGPTE